MKYDAFVVGENIRALRKKRGITLEQLSEKLEKSVTHLNLIELGNRKVSMGMLFQLMELFDVDANDILGIPVKNDKNFSSVDWELAQLPEEYGLYLKNAFMEMIHSLPGAMAS